MQFNLILFDLLTGLSTSLQLGMQKDAIDEQICKCTQNDAILELNPQFLTIQNAKIPLVSK